MKSILIPTDFSVNAGYAVNYGSCMASAINDSVMLFNTFQLPLIVDAGVLPAYTIDHWQKENEKGLQKIASQLQKSHDGLDVGMETRLGFADEEIKSMAVSGKYDMIVIGSKGAGKSDKAGFGNVANDIVRDSNIPVLVIPPGFTYKPLKKIALACHKDQVLTGGVIAFITAFVNLFNAQLHIVDVVKKLPVNLLEPEDDTHKIKAHFTEFNPPVHIVEDDELAHGINQFAEENDIGMIIMILEKHSFFERLFMRTHTGNLAKETHGPLLIVPGTM
jgi:nucleotide-binding universal stress UspA family protein